MVQDHVDFARCRRVTRAHDLAARATARKVSATLPVAARGVHEGGRRRRPRQLVEGHVLPEVLIPLPALDAGPLVDVTLVLKALAAF